ILQQVREMLDEYRDTQKKSAQAGAELKELIDKVSHDDTRRQCEALFQEMSQELSFNTFDRLATYLRLNSDESLAGEQKISLALSGWLLGADNADKNLAITLSLAKVRDVVTRYLTEPVKLERGKLFDQLRGMEGASPVLVDQLLKHMKPPLES